MHMTVVHVLLPAPLPEELIKSPYLTGIFQSSALWVFLSWAWTVARGNHDYDLWIKADSYHFE
jgi:palmitoyltransferase